MKSVANTLAARDEAIAYGASSATSLPFVNSTLELFSVDWADDASPPPLSITYPDTLSVLSAYAAVCDGRANSARYYRDVAQTFLDSAAALPPGDSRIPSLLANAEKYKNRALRFYGQLLFALKIAEENSFFPSMSDRIA